MYRIVQANLEHQEDVSKLFNEYRMFYRKNSDLQAAIKFIGDRMVDKQSTIFACYAPRNEITGFVQLYPIFSSTRMRKLWLLNDLFVAEAYRGKGIAQLLIDKSKELCRNTGACGLTLETAKNNISGNRLYDFTGFRIEADSNFYSWDVEQSS